MGGVEDMVHYDGEALWCVTDNLSEVEDYGDQDKQYDGERSWMESG